MEMSKDVYDLIETMNQEEIILQLVVQCAPVLMGIKPSNLLVIDSSYKEQVFQLFQNTSIDVEVVYSSCNKISLLLYRKILLENYLFLYKTGKVMKEFGYKKIELCSILKEFHKRYVGYMDQRGTFPHEMGLLLGYPVEDVKGFIEKDGKDCLFSGYWKVYSNPNGTRQLFEKYKEGEKAIATMLKAGASIPMICG